VYALTACWGVFANLADDFRHLQRSEIRELRDRKAADPNTQIVGSSTMPHKVNPKDFENVKSLWKAYAPRFLTVLMDQISEHQRDLTNSASGRYLAELFGATDYAITRTSRIVPLLEIDAARMMHNLEMSKDAIIAEPLYIILGLHGCPDPYDWSKKLVNAASSGGKKMTELISEEP